VKLRDGTSTRDSRLDRLVEFDPLSRRYPIRTIVRDFPVRGRTWRLPTKLDQGREGACVGFGWAHELAAYPIPLPVTTADAMDIYWDAQRGDPWPGGSYAGATPQYEGTSVLAGAQAVQARGVMPEYRWAFTIDDIMKTLAGFGPIVFGTVWKDSMFHPRPSGLLDTDGQVEGGHCWIGRGLVLKPRLRGEGRGVGPLLRATNSWGRDWGVDGDFYIRIDELETLLQDDGESCVPVLRSRH
jgi:hypothetical protein